MECEDVENVENVNENAVQLKKQKLHLEFTNFLEGHTVYETIPENMKILVFNIELSIQDSIEAMVKEDIYCGMIWDSELNKFIGLFTIRDFLNLIKVLYEKINILMVKDKNGIYNTNNLVSYLFPSNKIDLDRLDEIMEDPESAKYSETKSEKSESNDMIVEDELNITNENNLLNYKELFKIFKHININDYFTDIHPVK